MKKKINLLIFVYVCTQNFNEEYKYVINKNLLSITDFSTLINLIYKEYKQSL